MFAIIGESVVVRSLLVVGDSVRGDDGGMAALRECGELGYVAQRPRQRAG